MTTDVVTDLRHFSAPDMLPRTAAVLASVSDWWSIKARQAGLSGKWTDISQALQAQPPFPLYADTAADITASTSPEALGQLYVSSLADAERSKEGKHYTPQVLADRLWEMAREALGYSRGRSTPLTGLVRDPACGAGALLLPPLREHLRASAKVDPAMTIRALPSRIHGIDQDPWSAWLTNVILGAELLPTLRRVPETVRSTIPILAETGDGLATDRDKALISLQNPPYGRIGLTQTVRDEYAHVLYGHANLYGLFMAAGAADVQEDGVLAALVPTSFTAGRYFHRLRGHLSKSLPLHAVNFVEGRNGVFSGVLQETCLVTFRSKATRKVKVSRSNGHVEQVAQVPAPKGDGPWLIPRESVDAAIAAAASRMPLTLATAGWHASTGPLVWNRRKDDLASSPSHNRAIILWGADIDGGFVHRDPARDSMRYLTLSQKSDTAVMIMEDPAVLVQRTTAPEQTRRLVAADLDPATLDGLGGRVVVENHVNVLRPTVAMPLITRATLARVLQTRTLDRLVRCISGSVALSSYELDSLPLPCAATMAKWSELDGEALEHAVAAAYSPGAKR